jgi:hypothetical protein
MKDDEYMLPIDNLYKASCILNKVSKLDLLSVACKEIYPNCTNHLLISMIDFSSGNWASSAREMAVFVEKSIGKLNPLEQIRIIERATFMTLSCFKTDFMYLPSTALNTFPEIDSSILHEQRNTPEETYEVYEFSTTKDIE